MTKRVPARSVPQPKITEYLLNRDHEVGGPKAAFFERFGFSPDQWEAMATALLAHPDRNPVEDVVPSRWGTKYVVRCSVVTPDGRNPCILSVWNVLPGKTEAVFVTAYPADEPA